MNERQPPCRRCSECRGQEHHWVDNTDFLDERDPEFTCKHCPAMCRAAADDEPDGVVRYLVKAALTVEETEALEHARANVEHAIARVKAAFTCISPLSVRAMEVIARLLAGEP